MMLRWRVISQLTVHGSGPAERLPPNARSMSIRSDMYKSIEAVRKKREATKLEGQKKKEQPRYDKAVLQAHRELEDERLFEERKRVYGAEVAQQMLEEERHKRDVDAWNERKIKLRNKPKPPRMAS